MSYFHADHQEEGQRTVVTETHGPLEGRRVVRGREPECRARAADESRRREWSAADRDQAVADLGAITAPR